MSYEQILRIPILPFGMVNAYLIVGKAGCVLVDTGIPGSEHKILRTLSQHGLSFTDIKLIIVTHAHTDHAGSAARMRTLSNAPILAHEADAKFYRRKQEMKYCTTGWFGRLFLLTRVPYEPYDAFEPDILMEKEEILSLSKYGVFGLVRHTAGHTPGSIAVELDSRNALIGDLVSSGILLGGIAFKKRPMRPPFEDDPVTVARELEGMAQRGAQIFHMGHGGPLGATTISRHAKNLLEKFKGV